MVTWVRVLSQSLIDCGTYLSSAPKSLSKFHFNMNLNLNIIKSTSYPERYASVPVHQVSPVILTNRIMLQDLLVVTCFLALGSWITFPFVTHIRSYIAQYAEAVEWLFHGPQLLAKRYVSSGNLNGVSAAVLTRQPGSRRTVQHQDTKSRVPPGFFAATYRRDQSGQ